MFFFAFSTLVAIGVIRYALSFSNSYFIVVFAVLVLLALILRVYLSKRYGETRALPPLVAVVLFFAVNYYYAFNWGLLGLETAATLSQFSLVITLSTLTIILLVYYVFYRRRYRRVEDYVAEVVK
jgi:drug/metabolite transporter (DMT)-like permease